MKERERERKEGREKRGGGRGDGNFVDYHLTIGSYYFESGMGKEERGKKKRGKPGGGKEGKRVIFKKK